MNFYRRSYLGTGVVPTPASIHVHFPAIVRLAYAKPPCDTCDGIPDAASNVINKHFRRRIRVCNEHIAESNERSKCEHRQRDQSH